MYSSEQKLLTNFTLKDTMFAISVQLYFHRIALCGRRRIIINPNHLPEQPKIIHVLGYIFLLEINLENDSEIAWEMTTKIAQRKMNNLRADVLSRSYVAQNKTGTTNQCNVGGNTFSYKIILFHSDPAE